MKYILTALLCAFIAASFTSRKCEHVFVQVEQTEIKIEQPKWSGIDNLMPGWTKWPSGKQEGQELICVKCFHKQRQIVDYGQPYIMYRDHPCNLVDMRDQGAAEHPDTFRLGKIDFDTCLFLGSRLFKLDTTGAVKLK